MSETLAYLKKQFLVDHPNWTEAEVDGAIAMARLEDAAPDLLAVCEALLDGKSDEEVWYMARAAVAKARPSNGTKP